MLFMFNWFTICASVFVCLTERCPYHNTMLNVGTLSVSDLKTMDTECWLVLNTPEFPQKSQAPSLFLKHIVHTVSRYLNWVTCPTSWPFMLIGSKVGTESLLPPLWLFPSHISLVLVILTPNMALPRVGSYKCTPTLKCWNWFLKTLGQEFGVCSEVQLIHVRMTTLIITLLGE